MSALVDSALFTSNDLISLGKIDRTSAGHVVVSPNSVLSAAPLSARHRRLLQILLDLSVDVPVAFYRSNRGLSWIFPGNAPFA